MSPILDIQAVSKRFVIRHNQTSYLSLRDKIMSAFQQNTKEEFWALKDISFQVSVGEAVGIIGRNGAGKSTLLKILSRITPPTQGRIVCRGRIASLLEVGTGFHQELTGRENIFMNGSILGMRRNEIRTKFDEIVEFSGTGKFLDTQLKHYSSGMQLRLAFAVAVHLEPEILIIDEVLAVGDSVFQKKCMTKMAEVAGSGRTILFVSHNMQAIRSLCDRTVLLKDGRLYAKGETEEMIRGYLSEASMQNKSIYDLSNALRTKGKRGLIFSVLEFDKIGYQPGDDIVMKIKLLSDGKSYNDLLFGVNILDTLGNCVIHLSNIFLHRVNITHENEAIYQFKINSINIKPGRYSVSLFIRANEEIHDWIDNTATLEIEDGNVYNFENSGMIQGLVQPSFTFDKIYEKL